ncbi:MAG: glyoxalase [Deltaproteobacteria bacterium]|nr:glyoxalase [Deltaproteobacteria bacterium]
MPRPGGFHHVALACKDIDATHHFYEDLMGFPLVYTEIKRVGAGFFRHFFYDTGDGSCLAFFDVHDVGEEPDWSTAVSTACGLPVWVNHVAFCADAEKQEEVRARMEIEGIPLHMEVDHEIFYSLYWVDPNGIMVELARDTRGIKADPERARSLLHATRPTNESTIVEG